MAYFVGHKVPSFFYWPQSGLFCWPQSVPISFIGHKVANAFALLLPHSLLFGHEVAHAFGVNTRQDDMILMT